VEVVTSHDPTPGAAQLAERILDEVSKPDQNWCNIAVLARELAAVADAAASSGPARAATEGARRSRAEEP
jgi:hypothetical protein